MRMLTTFRERDQVIHVVIGKRDVLAADVTPTAITLIDVIAIDILNCYAANLCATRRRASLVGVSVTHVLGVIDVAGLVGILRSPLSHPPNRLCAIGGVYLSPRVICAP